MRDNARFLTVLQMCAAVNVFSRPTIEIDGVDHIIVTREDYERAVKLYLAETAETIFTGVPGHILDFFKKVIVPLGATGRRQNAVFSPGEKSLFITSPST